MTNHPDAWTSDQAYEPYVGRWSRLVAPRFLRWLPPAPPAASWCDVGCGTGALAHAILASERPARVLGIDPSPAYLAGARLFPSSSVIGHRAPTTSSTVIGPGRASPVPAATI